MTIAEMENQALAVDMFAGDKGCSQWIEFSDKFVTSRSVQQCHHCGCDIEKGERIRKLVAKFDGHMTTYRWCNACCWAMAISWEYEDNGDTLEARPRMTLYADDYPPESIRKAI